MGATQKRLEFCTVSSVPTFATVAENHAGEPVHYEVGQLIRGDQIGKVIGFSASGFPPISKDNKCYNTGLRTAPDVS